MRMGWCQNLELLLDVDKSKSCLFVRAVNLKKKHCQLPSLFLCLCLCLSLSLYRSFSLFFSFFFFSLSLVLFLSFSLSLSFFFFSLLSLALFLSFSLYLSFSFSFSLQLFMIGYPWKNNIESNKVKLLVIVSVNLMWRVRKFSSRKNRKPDYFKKRTSMMA